MRRCRNKTSSRAPNRRPVRTQPHGCGVGCATRGPPETCSRTPSTRAAAGTANPLRPGWAAHEWKRPPQEWPQGSPHEAGGSEQRRTDEGRAAWMRRRRNKTSSRAPNRRPVRTQPHGCGAGWQTRGPPETCSRTPSTRTGAGNARATLSAPVGPHMNRNGHRRNGHRGARTKRAALSNVGPTMVEPHGCGGATTRPHAAHPTSDQPRPSRMDAAPVAQPPEQRRTCSRTPSPTTGARCGRL